MIVDTENIMKTLYDINFEIKFKKLLKEKYNILYYYDHNEKLRILFENVIKYSPEINS